jgi:DNA-directed RNA polymerase subunit M
VEDVEAQKGQKHCPRCGSVSLRWASGLPQLWSVYDCQECGYRGTLVIEDGKLAQKIRKRWLKEQEEKARPK